MYIYQSILSPASSYGLTEVRLAVLGSTLYPCPPATPATLSQKAEGVSFTSVLQPWNLVQGTTQDLHYLIA